MCHMSETFIFNSKIRLSTHNIQHLSCFLVDKYVVLRSRLFKRVLSCVSSVVDREKMIRNQKSELIGICFELIFFSTCRVFYEDILYVSVELCINNTFLFSFYVKFRTLTEHFFEKNDTFIIHHCFKFFKFIF